ncbi:MAG: hypothetical protein GX429_06870 [Bacteroidales bacterium]|nr:hypothetical protein [Bacteroidales bacterium]
MSKEEKQSKKERKRKWEKAWKKPTCEYQQKITHKDGTRAIVCSITPPSCPGRILCPLWKCENCSLYILEKNPELISEWEEASEDEDNEEDLDNPIKIK